MTRAVLLILSIMFSSQLLGCSGICNPNAAGVAAGFGNSSGIVGLTGYGLAAIQLGSCAAYTAISKGSENSEAKSGSSQDAYNSSEDGVLFVENEPVVASERDIKVGDTLK